MQELKVATVNRVSFEQGNLQQWIKNYDDVSKDYFLRLFNIVFQVDKEDLERVTEAVASWHLEDGDDIDCICTNFGISHDELVSLLRDALSKCDKESKWVRFCWV